jgi:predicted ATPase
LSVFAACWLEVLPPEEIAEEITQNLDFLESQLQDLPPRQRSVRATFEYSWKRLTAAEQEIFMKLSAFRGGFTREAAREVAGATAQTLRKLADKSFITMIHDGRYQMHALLHQYGQDRLQASGMASMATNAHRDYFLTALGDWEADLKGRRQLAALNEIEAGAQERETRNGAGPRARRHRRSRQKPCSRAGLWQLPIVGWAGTRLPGTFYALRRNR